jgi:hypothetical protein
VELVIPREMSTDNYQAKLPKACPVS